MSQLRGAATPIQSPALVVKEVVSFAVPAPLAKMAHRGRQRQLRAIRNDRNLARFVVGGRPTGKQLGTGSYGSVEEVILGVF